MGVSLFVFLLWTETSSSLVIAELIIAIVTVGALWFAWRYFERPWRYEVDDEQLVADRLWGLRRATIRWGDITSVTKAAKRDLWRNWPEVEVHGHGGTLILIPRNLRHYTELIELIRRHAHHCRHFDAYP
jgi:hypothetical protein